VRALTAFRGAPPYSAHGPRDSSAFVARASWMVEGVWCSCVRRCCGQSITTSGTQAYGRTPGFGRSSWPIRFVSSSSMASLAGQSAPASERPALPIPRRPPGPVPPRAQTPRGTIGPSATTVVMDNPRECRLRLEFMTLYPGVPAGRWKPAGELLDCVTAARLRAGRPSGELLRNRLLDERHFEFRGGVDRGSSGVDRLTRISDGEQPRR
jgi:hypothetical protein